MNFSRNQKGSVLLLVMVVAIVFALVVIDLSSRFVSVVHAHHRFAVSNENMRVADELSKIVSLAYEYGTQAGAAGCAAPKQFVTKWTGSDQVTFCFDDPTSNANCAASTFNSEGQVCINFASVPVKIAGHDDSRVHFQASFRPRKNKSLLSQLIPEAEALGGAQAMPPVPTWTPNTFVDKTCAGDASDPAVCRVCGPGQPNICVEIAFCPADKLKNCAASEMLKVDMMVQR